jgi:hypothetical protein
MTDKVKTPFTKAEERLIEKFVEKRVKAQTKYPLLFILLVTFGAVATLQGFQRLIDKIPVLSDNPWILLVAGLTTLLLTGTLYKKLN